MTNKRLSLADAFDLRDNSDAVKAFIDEKIMSSIKEYDRRPRKGFHPSSFYGLCPRVPLLEALYPKADEPVSSGLQVIFDVGNIVHSLFQNKYLGDSGCLLGLWETSDGKVVSGLKPEPDAQYKEYGFHDDEFDIRGRIDGVVQTDTEQFILDIKTIGSKPFRRLEEVSGDYWEQVQIYMWKFSESLMKNPEKYEGVKPEYIRRAIVLYVDKTSLVEWNKGVPFNYKVFLVDYDENTPQWAKHRIDEWTKVEDFLSKNTDADVIKDRLFHTGRMCDDDRCHRAMKCDYSDECFAQM